MSWTPTDEQVEDAATALLESWPMLDNEDAAFETACRYARAVLVAAGPHIAESDAEWVRARLNEAATRTRVVSTVAELDALPVGTVLAIVHKDGSGPSVYVNTRDEGWLMATERCEPFLGQVDTNGVRRDRVGNRRAPLTVLYNPEETR